jgi:hypothetical protein
LLHPETLLDFNAHLILVDRAGQPIPLTPVEGGAEMLNGKADRLKKKAVEEAKRMLFITAYLWALFTLFEMHRAMVLRQQHVVFSYRVGFALINALILAKVILIAEALQAGKRLQEKPLLRAVLLKSALFAVILVFFNIVENVLVGLFHGKTLAQSMPDFAGGGLEGELLVGILIFVVLIPFFAFTELRQAIGEEEFHKLIFDRRK